MPRRFLGFRQPCHFVERLQDALEGDQEKPNVDEIIESQDHKLQEVKRSVFNGITAPIRLVTDPPVPLSSIYTMNSLPLMISTHYNDNRQSIIPEGAPATSGPDSVFCDSTQTLGDADIDFSKPENLFLLEAPIDARKDHNMLKLAYTLPKRTFMGRLLRSYPVNRKRLAFIQRRPTALKSIEVVGNLIVSAKGGEAKEVTISCQVCGQKFARQHQFQRHILTHPDPESKKFLCQICGKRFNRADHLNRHAILHTEVKVQKCLLCGEEFDRASHLDRHRRKNHPPAGQQPSQTPPATPLLKSPVSAMPDSPGYDSYVMLSPQDTPPPADHQGSGNNLHLLAAVATPEGQPLAVSNAGESSRKRKPSENGSSNRADAIGGKETEPEPERPYPCDVCGRKFIRATHLRRHMRIHTGEKPFACHICGRRYARGDYLRAHIHAHRRDKIHKCKHCGEVFHDLTRFADHCRLLHKDLDDEFGNPKPPPESSPPPPRFTALLENSLAVEQAEEITVVPSLNMMDMTSNSSIPITLVTLSDDPDTTDGDLTISDVEPSAVETSHTLHTANHTPMVSTELQLAQLQALAAQTDPHLLVQNGQLQVADTGSEVTILNHSPHGKATPTISYMDSMTQYVYTNSGSMLASSPPQTSPLMSHTHHSQ